MIEARWNGAVVAKSEKTIVIEGNHYFPPDSVASNLLIPSETTSVCPWKGTARYFDIRVGDAVNKDAAWTYLDPKPEAAQIRDYVAFWKGVQVG